MNTRPPSRRTIVAPIAAAHRPSRRGALRRGDPPGPMSEPMMGPSRPGRGPVEGDLASGFGLALRDPSRHRSMRAGGPERLGSATNVDGSSQENILGPQDEETEITADMEVAASAARVAQTRQNVDAMHRLLSATGDAYQAYHDEGRRRAHAPKEAARDLRRISWAEPVCAMDADDSASESPRMPSATRAPAAGARPPPRPGRVTAQAVHGLAPHAAVALAASPRRRRPARHTWLIATWHLVSYVPKRLWAGLRWLGHKLAAAWRAWRDS